MILRPGSCSWCSDQVSSLGELWHKLARLAWRRRVDKLAAGGILSWSRGLKRSNALKAANLQRNENKENNNCDRWRNSLPLSRPEKLLRLVPLADQSLRWTSSIVLQMFKSSGVEIMIGSFHLRPGLVSPLGRVEPADQLLGRALVRLHRRFIVATSRRLDLHQRWNSFCQSQIPTILTFGHCFTPLRDPACCMNGLLLILQQLRKR